MTYKWTSEGPAFEFPSPFVTENRFRTVRAWTLFACAAAIALVLLFVTNNVAEYEVAKPGPSTEPLGAWPHALSAALLLLMGGLDLFRVSRQRTLTLVPRQPASLMPDVSREGTGVSPGAAALMRALSEGVAEGGSVGGPFESWLKRLGPGLAASPVTLQRYLRAHFSQAALAAGLLLILLCGVAVLRPTGLAVGALVLGLSMAAVMAWHRLAEDQPACPPWVVGLVLGVGVAALALALFYDAAIPRPEAIKRLGLPIAAGVLLAAGLLIEVLGIRAARAQIELPRLSSTEGARALVAAGADVQALMREIDLEFHRRWTEGIPNRRYAWQVSESGRTPSPDAFTATVLEESQPLSPRQSASSRPRKVKGHDLLRWLDVLGLLLSTAGGLAWVALAYLQMRYPSGSWMAGALGLACLLAGGHALRVAHLLWSRVELESTITWLQLQGREAPVVDHPTERTLPRVDGLSLQARVVQARSVFYAAAEHRLGSRVLVYTRVDGRAAAGWITAVGDLLRQVAAQQAASRAAPPAQPPAPRLARSAPEPSPAVTRRTGRFCAACGTAVMANARFCQNCGQVLGSE